MFLKEQIELLNCYAYKQYTRKIKDMFGFDVQAQLYYCALSILNYSASPFFKWEQQNNETTPVINSKRIIINSINE